MIRGVAAAPADTLDPTLDPTQPTDAKADAKAIDPRQIQGLKRLRHILPLLASLHQVGCERDKAGNRELHFDEYVTLVLLWLFNPMLDSVRALQKAGELDKVSEQLGVKRFSPSSFSESVRVFDPGKLKAVVQQLAGEVKLNPVNADPRLKDYKQHLGGKALTMADGTVLDAIAAVARAAWLRFQDGTAKHAWKLHVQLDFDTLLPDVEGVEQAANGTFLFISLMRNRNVPFSGPFGFLSGTGVI